MRAPFLRNGDIACGFAGVFILGEFTAARNWNAHVFILWLLLFGAAAIVYLREKMGLSIPLCSLIALAIFSFPLSVFYYHLRVAPDPSGLAIVASASGLAGNPLLARAVEIFGRILPYRQASLLIAVISGSAAPLAPDIKSAMSRSGTSYIVGMYGYKIHLLIGAVFGACRRLCPRRVASVIAVIVVTLFVVAANAPVSALRAGIMAGLALLAEASGRRFNARIALVFTAALMVAFDPSVCASGGFILSFMSLVGIYALAPPLGVILQTILYQRRGRDPGRNDSGGVLGWKFHLITTAAVNLAILPVVTALYGDFPVVSFISNFFVALPFGAVIGMGILLALVGNIFGYAAFLLAPALNILLSFQLSVIGLAAAALPFPVSFSSPVAIVVYYLALAWIIFRYTPRRASASIFG